MDQDMATNALREELAKFFALIPTTPSPSSLAEMKMPGCQVDAFWHRLLENDREYIAFCASTSGTYLAHSPGNGFEEILWVKNYEERFGKLSRLWFTSVDGIVDEAAYERYLQDGVLIASWDCTPGMSQKTMLIKKDIDNLKNIYEINKKIDQLRDLGGPIPELGEMERIDEGAVIDSIKDKVDRFKIDKIKEKHNLV